MRLKAGACIPVLLLGSAVLAQPAGMDAMRSLEVLQRYSEAEYLSDRCEDYVLSWKAEESIDPNRLNLAAILKEALKHRPVQPNQSSACEELVAKYGPEGTLERDWIEKRP